MRKLPFHLVDVFTERMFGGNQLAVYTDGRGVSDAEMQQIAREMNLSETTFVLPPADAANDFRVRIFTTTSELPMAGHPTVGTAFILKRAGLIAGASTKFEEGVGVIPVALHPSGLIEMTQLLPKYGPVFEDRATVAEMLSILPEEITEGLPIEVISCGVPFLFVPLRSLDALRRVRPRLDVWDRALAGFVAQEVFVFTREVEHAGSTTHGRMFAPSLGIVEDPATGGASGPLGCYLIRHGLVPRGSRVEVLSEQGFEIGRPSYIHITVDMRADQITSVRVGGRCHWVGEGHIELP